MTSDGTDNLHGVLRKARIEAGITQAALAAQVGCTQSAVSMMEAGRAEALSKESLVKLAGILKVELPESAPEPSGAAVSGVGVSVCSNFNCPSNMPYLVGSDVYFMPLGNVGGGHHCIFCGELLTRKCPHCGTAVVTPGGCCASCGAVLVEMPSGYVDNVSAWVEGRLAAISAIRKAAERGGSQNSL